MNMRFSLARLAMAAAVPFFLVSISARADLVLDQSSIPPSPPTLFSGVWNRPTPPMVIDSAQTFTMGVDGRLAQVDVFVASSGYVSTPLTLTVVTTTSGLPNMTPDSVLGTQSVSFSSVPYYYGGFVSFTLPQTPSLQLHKGDLLGIVLSDNTLDFGGFYLWDGDSLATYQGGAAYVETAGGRWTPTAGVLGFKTWVDVPEPSSSLVPAVIGSLCVLSGRRRRPM